MANASRGRYLPPADVIKSNRTAVRARAYARARAERNDYRAELSAYRTGGAI